MRKFILGLLLTVAVAITGAGSYDPDLVARDTEELMVQSQKVLTTADYQAMVDELEDNAEITFFIPLSEKVKLRGICCEPPSSPCQGYCCWRCPDPGKGG
jgi:hypothetical protein